MSSVCGSPHAQKDNIPVETMTPSSQFLYWNGRIDHSNKVLALCILLCTCLLIAGAEERQLDPTPIFVQTKYGDIYDCVDIYKQPSLDHPLLKDHKVQMWPSWFDPSFLSEEERQQIWSVRTEAEADGQECPAGTVPIQRLPATAAKDAATRLPPPVALTFPGFDSTNQMNPDNFKRFIVNRMTSSGVYYGVSGEITVWENVVNADQATVDYVTAAKVSEDPSGHQIWASAGWGAFPAAFGDSRTRLFILWNFNGQVKNCLNTQCPGFVVVNPKPLLGGIISPVSTGQHRYSIMVYVFKDHNTTDWWFSFGNVNNFVGYWSHSIFPAGGFSEANLLQLGGAATCPNDDLCPPIGSGMNPNVDKNSSSFVGQIQIQNDKNQWIDLDPKLQVPLTNNTNCYGVSEYQFEGPAARYRFYYGGTEVSCS